MDIVHRFALSIDAEIQRELAGLGIDVETGFVGFDVLESFEGWPAVAVWARRRHPSDISRARFTDEETSQARWLSIRADAQQGFPQLWDRASAKGALPDERGAVVGSAGHHPAELGI